MRYILVLIIFLSTATGLFAQQPVRPQQQTNLQLGVSFYNSRDYEKALPLLKEAFENMRNSYYFSLYMTALIELERFEEAEMEVRTQIERTNNTDPTYLVYLGYLLEAQEKGPEAQEAYDRAIEIIPPVRGVYISVANTFSQFNNYEYARQTYLKGREVLPDEEFNYELARTYYSLRNYEMMMEEYLNLLRQDADQLARVQSSLASIMRVDIDNELRNKYRGQVLRRIQSEPNVIGYNRLLIWFFLQDRNFSSALRQTVALDRRTGAEDANIILLGRMALNSKDYKDARDAYEYLIDKGEENMFYQQAFIQNIHASYLQYTTESNEDKVEGERIADLFEQGVESLGFGIQSFDLIKEYAHLLAFYLDETNKSIDILERGLEIPRLRPEESGMLKTELADIYVYINDPWEATLLYSQVIEDNKTNTLGDDVKLKKAKLAYYMGNFSWAKAQLDVLKASTSKLTANDALDLSMLISNNLDMDTTAAPLQMFARADLLFFRNKDTRAMATLDSLHEMFPYHPLSDDILYRKANIEIDNQNYTAAAQNLEEIVSSFSYELLADDALYELATLYEYQLDEQEKAKQLYRRMLSDYPGSVFVEESREKYRELREIYPDPETEFMNGSHENLDIDLSPAIEGVEEQ